MRIRIPINPAFLENNDEDSAVDSYEKATKNFRLICKNILSWSQVSFIFEIIF